jgi:hypothetical protein
LAEAGAGDKSDLARNGLDQLGLVKEPSPPGG